MSHVIFASFLYLNWGIFAVMDPKGQSNSGRKKRFLFIKFLFCVYIHEKMKKSHIIWVSRHVKLRH